MNSHEILRRIECFQERLRVENLPQYADRFGSLCTTLINHPVCADHYETDIQWSILSFLLQIAKNPVQYVVQNQDAISLIDDDYQQQLEPAEMVKQFATQQLIESLKEDNLGVNQLEHVDNDDEHSELSVSF